MTGCRIQVFILILDSSLGLTAGIQSARDSIPETIWVRILHSAAEDNLCPFDSKIAYLCQSIEINNNKHLCMLEPGVKAHLQWNQVSWMFTHHRDGLLSSSFCLILDSSAILWVGIPSAGDLVYQTSHLRILYSAEESNLSPFDSKISCLCQSIKINNNTHISHQIQVRKPIDYEVKWAERSLIVGTGCWVQVLAP